MFYLGIVTFLASWLVTGLARAFLLGHSILDRPTPRGLHSVPTPRGGGIGIVAVFLACVPLLLRRSAHQDLLWALVVGGIAIAVVGFLDDCYGVPVAPRLLAQFAVAAWSLWHIGGLGPIHLGKITLHLGWLGHVVALVGLVWLMNAYNFMDGIDGLAGLQSASVSLLGSIILAQSGLHEFSRLAVTLGGASLGFLPWNWSPARLFMGDCGSGFLGFVLGVLAIDISNERPNLLWPWLTLLLAFVVDPTVTLIRRLLSGASWLEPHCNHAYQHAAREFRSHSAVTLAVALINVVWLLPLALFAVQWRWLGPWNLFVAAIPLVYLAIRFRAGIDIAPSKAQEADLEEQAAAAKA